MNVTGTTAAPSIGIIKADRTSVDLAECPLPSPHIRNLIIDLRNFITEASLVPYDIETRRGELKNIIVMSNHEGSQGILRFVTRTSESIPRIKKRTRELQNNHPWLSVITCNIQPLPAAILEGPEEIFLTDTEMIDERYGETLLSFAPQSFMQVTHEIAQALYEKAAKYVRERQFPSALDLFCGVGGFSLSIAPFCKEVTGVELSAKAIESAQFSAQRARYSNTTFLSADAEHFLQQHTDKTYDLIVTNPPRRGLSAEIIRHLKALAPSTIIYSSCSPETFGRDCAALQDSYELANIALFDMFAMSDHCEVLGFLERRDR
jgi:23S rRNA (uracil747-C5)-methyltransferase